MFGNSDAMLMNKLKDVLNKITNVSSQITTIQDKCTETSQQISNLSNNAINSSPIQYNKNNWTHVASNDYVVRSDNYISSLPAYTSSVGYFSFNNDTCVVTYNNSSYIVYLYGCFDKNDRTKVVSSGGSPQCYASSSGVSIVVYDNKIHVLGTQHCTYSYDTGWTTISSLSNYGIKTGSNYTNYYYVKNNKIHLLNEYYSKPYYTVKHYIYDGAKWSSGTAVYTNQEGAGYINGYDGCIYLKHYTNGNSSSYTYYQYDCNASNATWKQIDETMLPQYYRTYTDSWDNVGMAYNRLIYFEQLANEDYLCVTVSGVFYKIHNGITEKVLSLGESKRNFATCVKDGSKYHLVYKYSDNKPVYYTVLNLFTSYTSDTLRLMKSNKILCSNKVAPLTSNLKRLSDNMLEVTETGDVQLWLQMTGEDTHHYDFAVS